MNKVHKNGRASLPTTLAAILAAALAFTACGGSKPPTEAQPVSQQLQQPPPQQGASSLWAGATSLPCADYDTDEYFVGFGTANGSYKRLDIVHPAALANAQQNVRQKMQHAYKGMITDYMDYIGNNQGTDAATNLQMGGDQIIDRVINDTKVHCGPMVTNPDADGHISIFTGIRISKQETAASIANSIANKLSDKEKLEIRFNQQEFERKTEEKFKRFKENQNQ
ncbi:MAG: hypothetical protein LBH25_09730 [Fibromonadaceae bacterium]|jgi:hypothetical protein|nr:hypothetical protein [Fibromonadaceae bacterium]